MASRMQSGQLLVAETENYETMYRGIKRNQVLSGQSAD